MKTTAAVLVETGRPLELADLEVPPLKPGQVLVQIACSGVCHTQLLECRGHRGADPYLPHCLGHEGSGTVVDTGPDVRKCRSGDRVILSWIKGSGADVGGTEYQWQGRTVNAGGVTTFSRHAVVSENRVTRLADDVSFRHAALLGCAAATGMGAVVNTAAVSSGAGLAVFGTGGVGLCAVAAGKICGASPLIAVDVNKNRLALAEQMGATACLDAGQVDPVEEVQRLCPGGLDFAIEASGRPDVMGQALACVRPRGGTAVIIGNARHGEVVSLDPRQFNLGKRLLGTWGGDTQPDRDFPQFAQQIASGQLVLDPLLTDVYLLEQINQALTDLESGQAARPIIEMTGS